MRTIAITLITALTFSGFAQANELTCESSHLSTPAPNLEQIASNLARLRLEIYQMRNNSGEKSRANDEFKAKFAEFESIVGNKENAKNIFQVQMKLANQFNSVDESKQSNRKEKEQKEREKESIDPVNLARKMEFHHIRPGHFMMNVLDRFGEDTQVEVEITKPFAMMATPVTQMMWARIKNALGEKTIEKLNPSTNRSGEGSITINFNGVLVSMKADHPVEMVSWFDAQEWIHGLNALSRSQEPSAQTFLKKIIPDHQQGDIYDLPTEAQWEFVMKNRGQANATYFDREDMEEQDDYAWFGSKAKYQSQAAATLKPRMIDGKPFYDLEGNVSEWTRDVYVNPPIGGKDPDNFNGSGTHRVICGTNVNSIRDYRERIRRDGDKPEKKNSFLGLRLVRARP